MLDSMAAIDVEPTFSTIINGTTITEMTPAHRAAYMSALVLFGIDLILSVISFTFGVVTWVMLPKWRQFQHYVFLNLIVASAINMIGFHLNAHRKYSATVIVAIILLPRVIMSHWLLVTTVMIYTDIVNVFSYKLERRYLATNVFSWLVPCAEVSLIYLIDIFYKLSITVSLNYVMNILLLIANVVMYLIVVYNIVKLTFARQETRRAVCSKLLVATAASIPSGLATLIPIMVLEITHSNIVTYNIILIVTLLTIACGHAVFLTLKANRKLWGDYRRKRNAMNGIEI